MHHDHIAYASASVSLLGTLVAWLEKISPAAQTVAAIIASVAGLISIYRMLKGKKNNGN